MQTVTVRTTQNVFIEYPVAGLGDRIQAYFVDALIMIAYVIVVMVLLINIEAFSPALLIGLVLAPLFLYHLLFEIFMNGQSPGKRQMGIKVVRTDGTPATVGNYVIRWLIRLIEVDAMSGAVALIAIAVSGKGQRLGDMAAGTTVVRLVKQREVRADDLLLESEETYMPVFAEAARLNDRDIDLIHQALEVNRSTGDTTPVLAITDKIKRTLSIQTDLPPVKFLYTIIRDHGHITSGR